MVLLLKLFFLGVRQLSKPIASRAKDAAHSSRLLKAVAVGLGRGTYRLQTQVARLSEGKPPLLRVAQLEEEEALVRTARSRRPGAPASRLVGSGLNARSLAAPQAKGADTLSEVIIYSVAGATVTYEYTQCGRPRPACHLTPRHRPRRTSALSLARSALTLSFSRCRQQKEKKKKEAEAVEAERARREAIRLNDERQWAEFAALQHGPQKWSLGTWG